MMLNECGEPGKGFPRKVVWKEERPNMGMSLGLLGLLWGEQEYFENQVA